MGDHRAEITIKFKIHGKIYTCELDWINYSPNEDGVDQRVIDFFSKSWEDAENRYNEEIEKIYQEKHKDETEQRERKLLEELKRKYEGK